MYGCIHRPHEVPPPLALSWESVEMDRGQLRERTKHQTVEERSLAETERVRGPCKWRGIIHLDFLRGMPYAPRYTRRQSLRTTRYQTYNPPPARRLVPRSCRKVSQECSPFASLARHFRQVHRSAGQSQSRRLPGSTKRSISKSALGTATPSISTITSFDSAPSIRMLKRGMRS